MSRGKENGSFIHKVLQSYSELLIKKKIVNTDMDLII